MKRFEFTFTLGGSGETVEEAWGDAVSSFADDPGPPPEEPWGKTREIPGEEVPD